MEKLKILKVKFWGDKNLGNSKIRGGQNVREVKKSEMSKFQRGPNFGEFKILGRSKFLGGKYVRKVQIS